MAGFAPSRPESATAAADPQAASASTASDMPSYSRDALNKDLSEGFRQQQRAARERQVEHLALAKGLGELAVSSLKDGLYNPRKALPPLRPEEKKMFERMDFKDWRTARQVGRDDGQRKESTGVVGAAALGATYSGPPAEQLAASLPSLVSSCCEDLKESCPGAVTTFLQHLRSTSRATRNLYDARAEVEDNIRMVEEALSHQCAPLSFATLLDAVARALEAMERGVLTDDLTLPDCHEEEEGEEHAELHADDNTASAATRGIESGDAAPTAASSASVTIKTVLLHGAVEVEAYTREFLLPKAYKAIAIAHSAEWMLQYTMAFLRTTEAADTEEAYLRLTLLGRCVRLLGDTENFSSVLLSLEAKSEEYAGFTALRETADAHLQELLDGVEDTLDAILAQPFPTRRSRLLLVERGVQKKLQRALLFLNEIDYSWTPTVHFHWAWKMQFLSSTFHRIHAAITRKYMQCSMGFVDDVLYDQVADTRITGRYMGASPVQPKVSRARQVEYEKVTEGLTLQQIGMAVKGMASLVVGEQVCMGARYIVRQSTADFDAAWGFHMDETSTVPTEDDMQKKVARLAAKAKRQYTDQTLSDVQPSSSTFLTQAE